MNTLKCLKTYNQICKEMDTLYHNYAKRCGLSDMAYWILYSMVENDADFTQRDFCHEWFVAPQTVNSALKELEKRDIVFLEPVPGNRRNKWIKPTENGRAFIDRTIRPLMEAECAGFGSLSEAECEGMLTGTRKYVSALTEQLAKWEIVERMEKDA